MTRVANRLRYYRRPDFLTGAVIAFLAAVMIALIVSVSSTVQWSVIYLMFCAVTLLAVRAVPVEPGSLLRRRAMRRGLVGVITAVCLLLVVFSDELGSYYLLAVLVLICADFLLGRATQRLATAAVEHVDEWQESFRNAAHRVAYWLLAVMVVLVLGVYSAGFGARGWLADGPGVWLVAGELLLCLPAMVIAWSQPDPVPQLTLPPRHLLLMRRLTFTMAGFALLAPLLASLALPLAPVSVRPTVRASYWGSARCDYLGMVETVGTSLVQAQLPISALACWNGRRAFEKWGMNQEDCHLLDSQGAFVKTLSCSRTVAADGTLRFSYTALVSSAFLPFLGRVATLTVRVSRTGTVIQVP